MNYSENEHCMFGTVESDDEDERNPTGAHPVPQDHPWFPYDTKTVSLHLSHFTHSTGFTEGNQMFLLDLIDNLPRLQLSDAHMHMILWVMKHGRSSEVPTFTALRKKQRELAKSMGIQTRLFRSMTGNVFFMNDLAMTLALVSHMAMDCVSKY